MERDLSKTHHQYKWWMPMHECVCACGLPIGLLADLLRKDEEEEFE